MSNRASGTFDVTAERQPPYDTTDGLMLGRTSLEKRFAGELDATSHVEMLAAGTPTKGSAAYVALERVTGTLAGKAGSFALTHVGVMNRGTPSLAVTVVPDSAPARSSASRVACRSTSATASTTTRSTTTSAADPRAASPRWRRSAPA